MLQGHTMALVPCGNPTPKKLPTGGGEWPTFRTAHGTPPLGGRFVGQNNDFTRGKTSNIMPWGMLREQTQKGCPHLGLIEQPLFEVTFQQDHS